MYIQFVPSHRGIAGKKLVDREARAGHNIEEITEAPVPRQDKVRRAKIKITSMWQSHWSDIRNTSGKGNHLFTVNVKQSQFCWNGVVLS